VSGPARTSERAFEDAIEAALLAGGPDAPAAPGGVAEPAARGYGEGLPGGFHRRKPEEYDRALCLIPRDVLDFVVATQPKEWDKLPSTTAATRSPARRSSTPSANTSSTGTRGSRDTRKRSTAASP
jgi:hypothetical protein